jgi:hypothetical protein
MGRRNGH